VRASRVEEVETDTAALGRPHLVSFLAEEVGEDLGDARIIVDDEDAGERSHHLLW